MSKKVLSLILVLLMIATALAACTNPESPAETDPPLSYTEKDGVLLSGENKYRVVYAENIPKSIASRLANKLLIADPDENAKYEVVTDTAAPDDGTPEILLGLTNRALSTEAKDKLESALDYSIVVSGNKIAIFANTDTRLSLAIQYFTSKLVVNEIGQVFYPSFETYISKITNFTIPNMSIDGVSVEKFNVIIPTNATEDEKYMADEIAASIISNSGKLVEIKTDSLPAGENEILVGKTNRMESSEITSSGLDVGADFRMIVKNGKMAVAAGNKAGYNSALTYFSSCLTNTNGVISSDISTLSLSASEIKGITVGAAYINHNTDGMYFHKCTQYQMDKWKVHSEAIGTRSTHSTGVRLDFYTDSSFIGLRTAKNSGKRFELHINGEYKKTLSLSDTAITYEKLDNSNGENRITLIFPSNEKGALSTVQLSVGATVSNHTYDRNILFLGDSITQGVGTNDDSHSFAHITTKHFNANSIIQGVGGGVFDANTIDPNLDYDPDYIIVAFGCNDWSRNRNDEAGFRAKLTSFVSRLKAQYPTSKIIFITPIPRLDNPPTNCDLTFDETRAIIAAEATANGYYSINGADMLPAERQYYNDDLHPNTKGFDLYGKNLCEALKDIIK